MERGDPDGRSWSALQYPMRPSRVWLLTTTPFSPGNCPCRSRPPSTTSSTRIGRLLTEVMTRPRISRIRRISSARRIKAAADGLLSPSTLFTGSTPPPNRPTLRTVMATLSLVEVVATHRGVAVGQRRLELTQSDAVAAEAVGVGLNLVAPYRAAEAGDVHDPLHGPELALQHPVLHRFDVVERVDLAPDRYPWELSGHSGRFRRWGIPGEMPGVTLGGSGWLIVAMRLMTSCRPAWYEYWSP